MTYTTAVYTVKTPDDGQRNCPKHVEFYSNNKCEKLVHLLVVGFIIRIYHDARSPKRQICTYSLYWLSYLDITNAQTAYLKSALAFVFKLSSVHRTEMSKSSVPSVVKHPQITKEKIKQTSQFPF